MINSGVVAAIHVVGVRGDNTGIDRWDFKFSVFQIFKFF